MSCAEFAPDNRSYYSRVTRECKAVRYDESIMLSPEEEQHFNPRKLRTQLILAVATSIDALAIGISFACTGYNHLSQLTFPLTIIGVVSFLFSIIGYRLGCRFGRAIAHRLKPELVGGIILILIGVKILFSHLLA